MQGPQGTRSDMPNSHHGLLAAVSVPMAWHRVGAHPHPLAGDCLPGRLRCAQPTQGMAGCKPWGIRAGCGVSSTGTTLCPLRPGAAKASSRGSAELYFDFLLPPPSPWEPSH